MSWSSHQVHSVFIYFKNDDSKGRRIKTKELEEIITRLNDSLIATQDGLCKAV